MKTKFKELFSSGWDSFLKNTNIGGSYHTGEDFAWMNEIGMEYRKEDTEMFEVFQKLVLRGCFKTDGDYNVAKQTLLEITGINYEQEVDNL